MNAVKTVDLKDGSVLEIHHYDTPETPRNDCNLGIVAVFHNSYDFGDEVDFTAEDFGGWDEMEAGIRKNEKPIALLPIYMMDHSGITIKTSSFDCQWDSGQVGFIYTTNKKLDEIGLSIKNGESWPDFVTRIEESLRGEIKTLDQYLTGDVYGFQHKDAEGEELDSCWGFYGDDFKTNGILEHIDKELIGDLGDL
jgi:hypothetical protein